MDARWISAKEFADLEPINLYGKEHAPKPKADETMRNKHVWFRKDFEYTGGKYTIDVSADDFYKLYINGEFVGMGPSTAYYWSYNYNTFDITPFLKEGKNELTAHTLYNGCCNRYQNSGELRQGFWCRIFKDGEIVLTSDESFEYAYDTRFLPEAHALGYHTTWAEYIDPDKKDFDWQPAVFKKYADYTMVPQKSKTCVFWDYDDIVVTKLGENDWLFDMKKEIAAYTVIKANPNSVGKTMLCYAEELEEDGHAMYNMRCMDDNYDIWYLNGKDDIESFEWRAFRYLEVKGNIDPSQVVIKQRGYPRDHIKEIETDIPELKQIYDMCVNTVMVCSQETFMDCATRERGQYMGDMRHSGPTFGMLTGDFTPYRKSILDMFTSDRICPGLMNVVPGCHMQEIADSSLGFSKQILDYYKLTGDIELVKEVVPKLKNMVNYFKKFARPDGLLEQVTEKWNLVSWPQNRRDDYDFPLTDWITPIGPGCHNVINALYCGTLKCVEALCEIAGEPCDLGFKQVHESFHNVFFDKEQMLYIDAEGSKHASVFSNIHPMRFDYVPQEYRENVVKHLYYKFTSGLNIGMGVTRNFLEAFVIAGRIDLVFEVILSRGEYSWLHMIDNDATTVWESWSKEKKFEISLCHPFGTAPLYIMLRFFDGKIFKKDIGLKE